MKFKFIQYFKNLHYIVKNYHKEHSIIQANISNLRARVISAEQIIRDRTDLNADIHYRGKSYAIVIGRYKNIDYVNCFYLAPDKFKDIVDHLRQVKLTGINKIDAIPEFRFALKDELNKFGKF